MLIKLYSNHYCQYILNILFDDLESTMVNSFIDKYQTINDYVEYLYEKSSWTSLATAQKAHTANDQKKFSKILVKDPISKFSLSIYNDFLEIKYYQNIDSLKKSMIS